MSNPYFNNHSTPSSTPPCLFSPTDRAFSLPTIPTPLPFFITHHRTPLSHHPPHRHGCHPFQTMTTCVTFSQLHRVAGMMMSALLLVLGRCISLFPINFTTMISALFRSMRNVQPVSPPMLTRSMSLCCLKSTRCLLHPYRPIPLKPFSLFNLIMMRSITRYLLSTFPNTHQHQTNTNISTNSNSTLSPRPHLRRPVTPTLLTRTPSTVTRHSPLHHLAHLVPPLLILKPLPRAPANTITCNTIQ